MMPVGPLMIEHRRLKMIVMVGRSSGDHGREGSDVEFIRGQ